MTVSSQTSRQAYTGNGATTVFAVPFYFLANTDLVVVSTTGGVDTTLTLNTDYTLSGAGNPAGGTLTATTAPATGTTLTIYRDPPLTQLTDYQSNDPFPANSHELALDRLTMISQRLKDQVTRSLRLPDGDASGASGVLPAPSANKILGWDAAGVNVTNIDAGGLGALVTYGTAYANTFTGNGVQTAFTLSANPGSLANLDVAVAGVVKYPTTDYTYSGTTLTFTSAPANGASILVRYVGGLPSSYSGQINVTVSPGTAGLTVSDGTRSLIYTPNTTSSLNFNNGSPVNFQLSGSNWLVINNAARNLTWGPPTSGVQSTVQAASGSVASLFQGAASSWGGVSLQDGQAGTRQWVLASGRQAAGVFSVYDNTAAAHRYQIGANGVSQFNAGAATPEVAVTFSATAMVVDCSLSNVFRTTFTANVTTAPTFSNPTDGQTINWFITQDATGSRTITYPASFKWAGGVAGTLSTTANAVDLLVATYRSTTGFWYASLSKAFS